MSTCVLIPWRGGCAYRERALAWVLSRHAENGWPVVIGRHETGPWCKAAAVADALEQTLADVLVIADADVWTEGLPEAVGAVQGGAVWAMPHKSVHRLSEAATARLMAGEDPDALDLDERAYRGVEGGGVTVVRRETYQDCPLDPRFMGWGSEDESHGLALRELHGAPWRPRGPARLLHAWHPPQQRATRSFGSLAGRDLRKRYIRAQYRPTVMRALVEEAKAHELDGPVEPVGDDCAAVRG